jgi:hypothetical protein
MSDSNYVDSSLNRSTNYEQSSGYKNPPEQNVSYGSLGVNYNFFRASLNMGGETIASLLQKKCADDLQLGAVYKNVSNFFVEKNGNDVFVHELNYSRVVVLSQSCDLLWNKETRAGNSNNQDKLVFTVLVAPFFDAVKASKGEHLQGFDMQMVEISKKLKIRAKQGDIARHHVLSPEMFKKSGKLIGFEEGIIDFKHFFTVPVHSLPLENCIDCVKLFHREKLSQRFSAFLSRIGIPDDA